MSENRILVLCRARDTCFLPVAKSNSSQQLELKLSLFLGNVRAGVFLKSEVVPDKRDGLNSSQADQEVCCRREAAWTSPRGVGFADVDAAIEVCKLQFGAAAVDCGVDGLIDLDKVFAAAAAPILDDLLRRGSLNLDVEITENLSAIRLKAEVGFQIGGKRNVNVAVQRTEGHGLLVNPCECSQ